ncbi:MAG: hypothetical protein IKY16_02590 [Bacteroidales bacterium]|nr:hypothetical protein [Bacteroidales bacterium]
MGTNIPRPWKRPPTPKEVVRENEKTIVKYDKFLTPNELRKITGYGIIEEPPKIKHYDPPRKEHITNCPNCCAVITGPICEYCGTRFPNLFEEQDVIIPIYIGNKQIDEVITKQRTLKRFDSSVITPGTIEVER